jgi:hypothetical protein
LLAEARDGAREIAELQAGEALVPLTTESHVTGARLRATRDHGKIFSGDIFYLLDSQAEGFHRIWHYGEVYIIERADYCERDASCWASGESHAIEIWWARVRRTDGTEGWVRKPLHKLDGVLRSD